MFNLSKIKTRFICMFLMVLLCVGLTSCAIDNSTIRVGYDRFRNAHFAPDMVSYMLDESVSKNATEEIADYNKISTLSTSHIDTISVDVKDLYTANSDISLYTFPTLTAAEDKRISLECIARLTEKNKWQNIDISYYDLTTYKSANEFGFYARVMSAYFTQTNNLDVLYLNIKSDCGTLSLLKKIVVNSTKNTVETYSEYHIKNSENYDYKYTYYEEDKQFYSIEYNTTDNSNSSDEINPYSKGCSIASYKFDGDNIEGTTYSFGYIGQENEIGDGEESMSQYFSAMTSFFGNKKDITYISVYSSDDGETYELRNCSEDRYYTAGFTSLKSDERINLYLIFNHANYDNIKRVVGTENLSESFAKTYSVIAFELADGSTIDPRFIANAEFYEKYHNVSDYLENRITDTRNQYGSGNIFVDTIIHFSADKEININATVNEFLDEVVHPDLNLQPFELSLLNNAQDYFNNMELFGKTNLMTQSENFLVKIESEHIRQSFVFDIHW